MWQTVNKQDKITLGLISCYLLCSCLSWSLINCSFLNKHYSMRTYTIIKQPWTKEELRSHLKQQTTPEINTHLQTDIEGGVFSSCSITATKMIRYRANLFCLKKAGIMTVCCCSRRFIVSELIVIKKLHTTHFNAISSR